MKHLTRVVRLAVLAISGVAASASCRTAEPRIVDFSESSRSFRPDDYTPVRERWTQHDALIRDVGTVIEVWSTYKSWEFRQAYLEKYFDVYRVSREARSALSEQQLQSSRETYEFHVTAQTTDWKWNDLEKRDSPWKVSLLDATGAELLPVRIEVLKLPQLYEELFFPTRTDFSKTYRIRFDRGADSESGRPFRGAATGRLILRVAGPLGRIDLVWQSASQ